jgi:hypothetical protein
MTDLLKKITDHLNKNGRKAGYCPMSGSIDVEVNEHVSWYFGTADGENWGADLTDDEGHVLTSIEKIGVDADCEDDVKIFWFITGVLSSNNAEVAILKEEIRTKAKKLQEYINCSLGNFDDWAKHAMVCEDRHALEAIRIRNTVNGAIQSIENIWSRS